MTKSYEELKKESARFVAFLQEQNIDTHIDESSYRDYNVKLRERTGNTLIMYHKPSKKTFSLGTHEITNPSFKDTIEDLFHQFQYPKEQAVTGLCAYVDGSFYRERIGWGLVLVEDGLILEEKSGVCDLSPEEGSRQIAGEVQSVLEAVEYALDKGILSITIYYDYIGLEKWATGQWKAQSAIGQYYKAKMMQYKISITWKKVKAHTGNRFNELADKLAKKS